MKLGRARLGTARAYIGSNSADYSKTGVAIPGLLRPIATTGCHRSSAKSVVVSLKTCNYGQREVRYDHKGNQERLISCESGNSWVFTS